MPCPQLQEIHPGTHASPPWCSPVHRYPYISYLMRISHNMEISYKSLSMPQCLRLVALDKHALLPSSNKPCEEHHHMARNPKGLVSRSAFPMFGSSHWLRVSKLIPNVLTWRYCFLQHNGAMLPPHQAELPD